MIATIAAPNTSMRNSAKARPNSGSVTKRIAASTTPIWLPMPPSTTIARIVADFDEGEAFRADEPLPRGEETAGEAAEHRADRKRRQLDVGRVDAERAAGDLVLAQRFPGAADRQPADAQREQVGDQRQRQDQVIEKDHSLVGREVDAEQLSEGHLPSGALRANGSPKKRRPRDAGDAVGAAGHRGPIQQHQADDLAKAKVTIAR